MDFIFIFSVLKSTLLHSTRSSESIVSENAGIGKLVYKESLLYPETESNQRIISCRFFILFHRLEGSHSIASEYVFRTRIFSKI